MTVHSAGSAYFSLLYSLINSTMYVYNRHGEESLKIYQSDYHGVAANTTIYYIYNNSLALQRQQFYSNWPFQPTNIKFIYG